MVLVFNINTLLHFKVLIYYIILHITKNEIQISIYNSNYTFNCK